MSDEKVEATKEAGDEELTAFERSLAALAQVPKAEIDALEADREKRAPRRAALSD